MRGGRRPGAGRKPDAGLPRTYRFEVRLAEHEKAEIDEVVPPGARSDLCRRLLLNHVRSSITCSLPPSPSSEET